MNEILQTILTVLGSVLGGGGIASLFYFRFSRRVKAAEAKAAEIDNELKLAKAWEDIANERGEQIKAKDNKIDKLYGEVSEWRDRCTEKDKRIAELEVKQITFTYKACERRKCPQREPETGY